MRYKITMRTLLALTCCLALTAVARAEDQDNNKNKKEKHEQKSQQAVTTSGHGAVNVDHGKKFQTLNSSSQSQFQGKQKLYTPNNFRTNGQVQSNAHLQTNKSWHTQKFTLQKNTGIQGVKFQGTTHIAGSQNWQGNNYNAFRIYTSQRHDRDWWSSRYNR